MLLVLRCFYFLFGTDDRKATEEPKAEEGEVVKEKKRRKGKWTTSERERAKNEKSTSASDPNDWVKISSISWLLLFSFFISFIPWLKKIIWVIGILRRTVASDWLFNNLCGSHLQSRVVVLMISCKYYYTFKKQNLTLQCIFEATKLNLVWSMKDFFKWPCLYEFFYACSQA